MTAQDIKNLGREKAIELKDSLEDQNCNLDYNIAEEEILIDRNNKLINLIDRIFTFNEV